MRGNLNETSCFGKVDGGIPDFRQENCIDCRVILEVLQDTHPLGLWSATVNVHLIQPLCIGLEARLDYRATQAQQVTYLERIHIVREHDDLIATFFMIINEELARLKFLRIHAI